MNRSNFAFFVALLIHFLFFLVFWIVSDNFAETKKEVPYEQKIKVSLKELPKPIKKVPKKNVVETKPIQKPTQIAPPMIKGSQLKKIIKKETVKYQPKKKATTPKLNPKPAQKVKPKIKQTPKITKKEFIPLKKETIKKPKQKPIEKKDASMGWLYEDKVKDEEPQTKIKSSNGMSTGRNIKELYGSKFGELSQAQQEYILDNQEIMRRITQQVLTRQASVSNLNGLNVNRINVIEFYLHPNGDMSDFKFLQKSGYFLLDDITKVTIEYAYSKYPRPKEKTLIRYNVMYDLRSY